MNLDEKDTDNSQDFEEIHLLKHDSKDAYRIRRSRIQITTHIIVLYGIIAALVVVFLSILNGGYVCTDPSQVIPSLKIYLHPLLTKSFPNPAPAQEVIEYETRVFAENFISKGPYMGREDTGIPTNETDALWEDLFQFGVSQIPYSQARLLPNATELIPGTGDQYIIELDVFHQLHCLNAVRKTLYPERYTYDDYYLDDGAPPGKQQRNYTSTDAKHFDHCIDAIRQSIMCHGDIATVYWRWIAAREVPLPRLEVTHTCRNFDKIRDWGKAYRVQSDPRWSRGPPGDFKQSY
ncbi:hypothetical protein MMC12_004558 [Toensbergia leucococca]|nr:hypothetical protein [Toensbergia leucococca]